MKKKNTVVLFLNIRSRGAAISKFKNYLFLFGIQSTIKRKYITTNWTIKRGGTSTNYACQLGIIIDCSQYIVYGYLWNSGLHYM